jgi:hypothetical protein
MRLGRKKRKSIQEVDYCGSTVINTTNLSENLIYFESNG